MKAPVAGLGGVGPTAAARPGEVHANRLLAGWSGSMSAPPRTHLRPGILLDRDGTIIVDHGYVGSVDRVEFIDAAPEAIAKFNRASTSYGIVEDLSQAIMNALAQNIRQSRMSADAMSTTVL